jgi:hypothetical protein
MALSVGPVHKLQCCFPRSSQGHRHVVHRKRHLQILENVPFIVVDTWKTYVLLPSVPSPLLIGLCIHSGCRKKHPDVSCPLIHFGPGILSHLIKALPLSSLSMTSLILIQSSWPFFSTSKTLPSRVSVLCCLLSSSSSVISQTASKTFSFTLILHTRMARSNLISIRSYDALKMRSGL